MLSRTQSLILFAAIQLSSFTCQLMLVKLLFITVQLKGELIIDWNLNSSAILIYQLPILDAVMKSHFQSIAGAMQQFLTLYKFLK